MYQLLQPYEVSHHIEIKWFNIDGDSNLQSKYGQLIPVLSDIDDNEICHYFFDKHRFEQLLND